MHARLFPKPHKFIYRVFSIFLDLDNIDSVSLPSILKINRWGLFSFYSKDHGSRDGQNLKLWANNLLETNSQKAAQKIYLLSFPRVLGLGFSPLSIFFCYNNGNMYAIIYEVKNTLGDQVTYTLPVRTCNDEPIIQYHQKEMYVSPFIEMDQLYEFIIKNPEQNLAIKIKQSGVDGKTLIATHNAKRIALTNKNLFKSLLTHPLMGIKILLAIHWEALRLFVKGVKVVAHKN